MIKIVLVCKAIIPTATVAVAVKGDKAGGIRSPGKGRFVGLLSGTFLFHFSRVFSVSASVSSEPQIRKREKRGVVSKRTQAGKNAG